MLKGSRVFVTGGASGIGLATVKKFWAAQANLIVIDLPNIEQTEFRDMQRVTYIQANVCNKEDLLKIEAEMANGVDVLVNNAGITRDSSLLKMTEDMWDQVIDVNLKAVWRLSQIAVKYMKEKKSGVILNAASVVAHYGNFGQSNYVASKAGVIGMSKTMAKELGKYGIRVNAVAPGFIATEMVKKMPESVLSSMEDKTPLGRLGDPDDIANAYLFLASENGSFITGTCLNVDGGIVIG